MLNLQIKHLEECKNLELIRINISGETYWGIVGQRSDLRAPVLILSENAYCLETSDGMNGIKDALNQPVLSYGTDFAASPEHHEKCNVVEGPLFSTPRSLVLTKGGTKWITCMLPDESIGFFDLETGIFHREISVSRVAFSDWLVWASGMANQAVTVFYPKSGK